MVSTVVDPLTQKPPREDVDLSVASEEAMDGQKPESFMIKDNQNRVLPFEELEDGDITLEPMNFPLSLFRQAQPRASGTPDTVDSFRQDGPDYQESEFPCEHEVSITEDVRALIEWVRPNDLPRNQALEVQTSTVDKLVSDNVTAKTFDKALGCAAG
ncbi:hypothetical protein AK812_SmicGene1726 [Symbiodinium microadriaticum]|uniref:Uncharacterized protein n=1 Tax=Symbiodinium microadriaticum TaxID=2951 RepID=A0A1Q9F381_SYMMI|nr:hypothetical protein AK812_SmicGene1726 [Symbiodinium microadriaticum]